MITRFNKKIEEKSRKNSRKERNGPGKIGETRRKERENYTLWERDKYVSDKTYAPVTTAYLLPPMASISSMKMMQGWWSRA